MFIKLFNDSCIHASDNVLNNFQELFLVANVSYHDANCMKMDRLCCIYNSKCYLMCIVEIVSSFVTMVTSVHKSYAASINPSTFYMFKKVRFIFIACICPIRGDVRKCGIQEKLLIF